MRNIKAVKRLFVLFLIPITVAFLFELLFKGFIPSRILNVIENVLFAVLLLIPLFFLTNKIISKVYITLALIIFSFCLCFETLYFYLFNTSFSPSSIFVVLDSNSDEAKEFIDFYLDVKIIFFVLLLTLITLYIIIKEIKISNLNFDISNKGKLKVIGIILVLLLFLKVSKLIVYNLPYLLIKSSIEYYEESKILSDYIDNFEGNFKEVSRPPNDEKELYVVIIGESTSRSHFGLYNYYRETTPELNKYKSDLLIYDDVISPHVFSIWSLTKVLTLGNYENPEKISEGSIIQLINKGGLKTYWLSNQRPIGPYESLITKITLSANKHEFITTTIAGKSKVLDEKLLPELDKALMDNAPKKVIFLHLMGTHQNYENRNT